MPCRKPSNESVCDVQTRATITNLVCRADQCKGVRCPPIFSLSNLINIGWLVRNCVDIYTSLIAGINRKAYLLHASFALKDSHCQ